LHAHSDATAILKSCSLGAAQLWLVDAGSP